MNYKYIALTLLLAEIIIAAYIHDTFVRPYVGDVLVSALIYCTVKSFVNIPVLKTAIYVLLFCYLLEVSQYFDLVRHLGLQNFKIAYIVLGSYFTWVDMLCYTIGMAIVLFIENIRLNRINTSV